MPLLEIISRYTRYNHWANESLTRWLRTLGPQILYKDTPSSFSSIDLTVQHMNLAQLFWLAVIGEGDVKQAKQRETFTSNAAEQNMDDLLANSQKMIDQFTAFSESELLKQLATESLVQRRYEYIIHVVNHNTHHRGQIITMARCLGITHDLPPMDYDVFLWYIQNRST
jgi:uncharacterized damage-inducible protein DinB